MMFWERILGWLDNPIFVKHMRSRLRVQALLSGIVVVQALCLCIAWAGFQLNSFSNGGAFSTLLILQIIIIVAVGGAQVASSVGGCRTSGILDFHRVSPLSRDELTLGFFFGAPIREYVLLATTLPYAALCVGFGAPSAPGLIQLMIALVAFAWLFHGIGLLSSLLAKPRAGSRGGIGAFVFVVIMFSWAGLGVVSRAWCPGRYRAQALVLWCFAAVAGGHATLHFSSPVLPVPGGAEADGERADSSAFKGPGPGGGADDFDPLCGRNLEAAVV